MDKQYMNECSNIKDYEFLKEEFNKIIELDFTIKFAYLIRLHSTPEHIQYLKYEK